ncbi:MULTISPECIES: hypothetical protein [unclassified Microcoleus]|uniref:hypothetical protein n=1 Tax=unclassified Microcoleus TaxID=2642155 RepID=UPI002FD25442
MTSLPQIEEEIQEKAQKIQEEVDKIFHLARDNNWNFKQFAKKILAGAVESDLGYFAIAAQLVQNVTGLEGENAIQILKCLLADVAQLDSVKIEQTQTMFVYGLIINKIKAHPKYRP